MSANMCCQSLLQKYIASEIPMTMSDSIFKRRRFNARGVHEINAQFAEIIETQWTRLKLG